MNIGYFKSIVSLSNNAAKFLADKAEELAIIGGPQATGSNKFKTKDTCFIIFENLGNDLYSEPDKLPRLEELENDFNCLKLASSNQILLNLVEHFSFAYDIDNYGKVIRFVGNFKGGGAKKLESEQAENVDKSSHSSIALGAHTEAPYHCIISSKDGHSPAPSALILTARWNPLQEPTSIIPVESLLKELSFEECLALTTQSFDFTRSETFTEGKGTGGEKVSILEVDEEGRFAMKYNSYRFTVNKYASKFVKNAFEKFTTIVNKAQAEKIILNPNRTIIINNNRALHCRDIIQDNRRLLIRLFGYTKDTKPILIKNDPIIVQG